MVIYADFLAKKSVVAASAGFQPKDMVDGLFEFQRDCVRWACKKGRAALFHDCGLGKSLQQLEWARQVCSHTGGSVLILAPLAVSAQTKREGQKFGINTRICRTQSDVDPRGINIANYEILNHFEPSFAGIVIDESSILKGDGPMRKLVQEFSESIHYRLACTATPAPNDHMELGNHAEYLGVMKKSEMFATFFVHDGGDTSKWRIKGHAVEPFWRWVASWAVMLSRPSDLGYEDGAFCLPPIYYHEHVVPAEWIDGSLFPVEAKTMDERRKARRDSMAGRVARCADLVNSSNSEPWLVWCDLNDESRALTAAIPGAVEVTGSDSADSKERTLLGFASGDFRVLVSKPLIAGWGLNYQHCRNMAFVGLSDSWEQVYQATRRCWRFGQQRDVHVHFITGEAEGAVVRNIKRKEEQSEEMANGMRRHMRLINTEEVHGTMKNTDEYTPSVAIEVPSWLA